ncbi:hypothetical protein PSMA106859_04300 [Pseudoalteromonas maricaloris]
MILSSFICPNCNKLLVGEELNSVSSPAKIYSHIHRLELHLATELILCSNAECNELIIISQLSSGDEFFKSWQWRSSVEGKSTRLKK